MSHQDGSVCIERMLRASGSHLAQNCLLIASSLRLAAESIGVLEATGSLVVVQQSVLIKGATGGRCRCSVLASTVQTLLGRNKKVPG